MALLASVSLSPSLRSVRAGRIGCKGKSTRPFQSDCRFSFQYRWQIMVMSFINFGLVGVEAESCSVSTLRILARSVAQARPTRRVGWVVDLKRKD